jgi:3-oxoacyl-[acyl-carrier-protein] synthase III
LTARPFRIKVYLPAQAASEAEATLTSWKVSEGAAFRKGDLLAEAESAKAAFPLEAPCDGMVVKLLCAQGDAVPFEKPVMEIETADESMKQAIPVAAEQVDETHMALGAAVHGEPETLPQEICLVSLGGYLPDRVVSTAELVREFPDITEEYILGVTGVRERRWARADEKPSDMAYRAATVALGKAGMSARDLNAIVVTTGTPDVVMPSTACILQGKLGARGIPAFDLNAACSGWLYGLSVARGLILAGSGPNVLVVGVERQSQLLDKKDKGTYFLFGDGAGAAIVSGTVRGHLLRKEILIADSKGLHMARREFPGYLTPSESNGADPWIRLDGHALFRFATESFSTIIHDVIEKNGWRPQDVRWVVPHQANGRILKAAAKKSGVPFDRFFLNIDHVGNTSSASIPLALLEIEKGLQNDDKLVMCSVGAGITAAAISLQWRRGGRG